MKMQSLKTMSFEFHAIFFYTLSVLGFLAFAAAGTTYWHAADPKISVSLKKLML